MFKIRRNSKANGIGVMSRKGVFRINFIYWMESANFFAGWQRNRLIETAALKEQLKSENELALNRK